MDVTGLGVDFGTSHTIAVLSRSGGEVTPLLFDGSPVMASAVYATEDGGLLTGRDAVNAARIDAARFEPNPKRRVDDGQLLLGDHEFDVADIFAAVLSRVRSEVQRVAGTVPGTVMLTHPATWGPTRRLVLETAAQRAGFVSAELMPEPVAAAAYFSQVLRHQVEVGNAIVVYDLGGGTFDASVVARTSEGFEVLAVDGLGDMGSVDIDHALVTHLGQRFQTESAWQRLANPQSTADRIARRLLYEDVRMAKEALSRRAHTEFPIPLLDTTTHLTREELETLTRPLLDRAVVVTKAVIHASKLPPERITAVFLVGGASRMPLAATTLHQGTGHAPTVIEQLELVVAQGAATAGNPADPALMPASAPTAPHQRTASPQQVLTQSAPPDSPHAESTPRARASVTEIVPSIGEPEAAAPRSPAAKPSRIHTLTVARALMWTQILATVLWWGGAIIPEVAEVSHSYKMGLFVVYVVILAAVLVGVAVSAVVVGRRRPAARRFAVRIQYGFIAYTAVGIALLVMDGGAFLVPDHPGAVYGLDIVSPSLALDILPIITIVLLSRARFRQRYEVDRAA